MYSEIGEVCTARLVSPPERNAFGRRYTVDSSGAAMYVRNSFIVWPCGGGFGSKFEDFRC